MTITFPTFRGIRCLMMPYIQGEPDSVPEAYRGYGDILQSLFFEKRAIGFLTIDESVATQGTPHRGQRAKFGRALHTEAGRLPGKIYAWGGGGWGRQHHVELEPDVAILIANNLEGSCAVWDSVHEDTSDDGDIGDKANQYPYTLADFMKAGEVRKIGIFTPHESLPVSSTVNRQFLRIISSGVHGREPYFTQNPLVNVT